MKPRLIIALLMLALAPIAALVVLGAGIAEREAQAVQTRFDGVVSTRLDETARAVERVIDGIEGELLAATEDLPDAANDLRKRIFDDRRISHLLVFDAEGRVVHPPPDGPLSADERALLERTRGLWENRDFARTPAGEGAVAEARSGWHLWYWGGGLNLMYRRQLADGRTVAVEVDRPRLLSAVIGALPTTREPEPDRPAERSTLLDSSGRAIYHWGHLEPDSAATPRIERALAPPLEAWRLTWIGARPPAPAATGLYAGLAAVALAIIGIAVYFYRASTFELRRAARRVTFVNQVSHELKTPLTNIRMYAELLDDALWDADDKTRRHLGVIVDESQRLSRLIGNILTFARQQRERLALRPVPNCLDDLVHDVLEHFEPVLAAREIEVITDLDAPETADIDADAVEQILGNLLGNVEKYAAEGREARIVTRQDGDCLTLTVADRGPGIARAHRARIFDAFYRASDALSEGVSGTGIGLGIARGLAQLHGGDLVLESSDEGARFTATLRAPRAGSTASEEAT